MDIGTSFYDYINAQIRSSIEQNLWNYVNGASLYFDSLIPKTQMPESTDQNSINILNKKFLDFLRSKEIYFVTLLHRVDFEDGMTNDAIAFILQNYQANESVTCNWLNEIYGKHQKDPLVLCGILRIIAFLRLKNAEAMFIPMIIASLKNDAVECQEAALMLIEVLRTKECLDAINSATFTSAWIQDYAQDIANDLKEELESYANQENQVDRMLGPIQN